MRAGHIRINRRFPAPNPSRINTSEKRRFNFTRINTSKNHPANRDIFSISFIPKDFKPTKINTSGHKDLKSNHFNTSKNTGWGLWNTFGVTRIFNHYLSCWRSSGVLCARMARAGSTSSPPG